MKAPKIRIGDVFSHLTVIALARPPIDRYLICRCTCGAEVQKRRDGLLNGLSRSCGCEFRKEASVKATKHGYAVDGRVATEYTIWSGLKSRCLNPNEPNWPRYGGRGIKVCDRWKVSFQNFLNDMGPRPSKQHSIDRINNDGDYEPSNCRWATRDQQYSNRSNTRIVSWMGESLCAAHWEKRLNLNRGVVSARLRLGWSIERALTTP